jgi:cell division septal protein FtsQ
VTSRGTRYRAAAGTPRRQPRVRRASARLTPTRAAAILAMLVSAGAVYGLAGTPAFGFSRLEISGATLTPESTIRSQVGVPPGTNLVGLSTGPILARLREIPSVDTASVAVQLPDVLHVSVEERRPVLLWGVGTHRFTVDGGGYLFAELGPNAPAAVAALPTVFDQRAGSQTLTVRSHLDPTDLDAATRLGSLTPDAIGSKAANLTVSVTDERGFTLGSGVRGWLAVFGFYGRSQRTPALIQGQVQLLTKLLDGREDTIQTVILADDRDGTYIPKATARPSASARP